MTDFSDRSLSSIYASLAQLADVDRSNPLVLLADLIKAPLPVIFVLVSEAQVQIRFDQETAEQIEAAVAGWVERGMPQRGAQ